MPNTMQKCWLIRRCMTNSALDLHQKLHSTTQMLHVGLLAGTLLAAGCLPAAPVLLLLAFGCFCRPGWLSAVLGGRLAGCCGQVANGGWRDGWVAISL